MCFFGPSPPMQAQSLWKFQFWVIFSFQNGALETPLPSVISNKPLWCGYYMDIFWKHMMQVRGYSKFQVRGEEGDKSWIRKD